MFLKFKISSLFFLIFILIYFASDGLCVSWKQIKGNHFIVEYADGVEYVFVNKVLSQAEIYYDKIASQLGYSRYDDYWTWDNRTKIIIYLNKESFIQETNQPLWSVGITVHDRRFFETRTIITYQQDNGFLNGVLPHEIGHLIFRDFIGKDKEIPVWFDEGVAQLYEASKKSQADKIMRFMVNQNIYIPFNNLMLINLAKDDTQENIAIFYSQSVSIVDFLIKKFGSSKFLEFLMALRDGKTFSVAIDNVYNMNFKSLGDLEEKWVNHIKGKNDF